MRQAPATRLLTRHFFRRFFDNDLISPHIDLHENVTLILAALVSTTIFLSVILAAKAMFGIPTPGPTAVLSLIDNFRFLGASMIAMALVAALQWDALSLDARDTYNLGPLPIQRSVIVRAKLTALVMFAAGFAVAVNLMPTVVYQSLLVAKIPVGLTGLLRLVLTHALVSTLASAFGFLAIVALRELLRAVLGAAWFARISTTVQALLVLFLVSALLLLPGVELDLFRRALPPSWFLGLAETIGGGVIANLTGLRIPPRMVATNDRWLAFYHSHEPFFREVAPVALFALAAVTAIAVAAYAWNVRRLPQPAVSSKRHGRYLAVVTRIFARRDPIARAGFVFALQAVVRSAAHRLSMAAAAALAVAMSYVVLGRIDLRHAFDPAAPPHSLLAFQTIVLTILLGGFRQAVRRPAELRANWIMQIAWRGGEGRFLSGVKRAAIVAIGLFVVSALFPFHAWLLGARVALGHAAVGLVLSVVAVEALFAGYRNVPFASSYEPAGHVKTLGPIAFMGFLFFVYGFTRVERIALQTQEGLTIFLIGLIVTFIALRIFDRWTRRGAGAMKFADAPEPATQWLGLSG